MRIKNLKLYNYQDQMHIFNLMDKEITMIVIEMVSGDEIATIFYDDDTEDYFDSDVKHTRQIDDHDGVYIFTTQEEYDDFNNRACHYDHYLSEKY